jgi:hypothetical protein
MTSEAVDQNPQPVVEGRKKVELLHPINHDFIQYSRGIHELDESLANVFLSLKDPINKKPIAREFVPGQAAIVRGTTKPVK